MSGDELPTFDEASIALGRGVGTPLHELIWQYEPTNKHGEEHFRNTLADIVALIPQAGQRELGVKE